jgi:hypothetical protein
MLTKRVGPCAAFRCHCDNNNPELKYPGMDWHWQGPLRRGVAALCREVQNSSAGRPFVEDS